MNKKKKHALTLVEMMLVIVIIGIIGGALAFNLRGSLDKGKEFKTKETKKKIEAILNIAAVDYDDQTILSDWKQLVVESPLANLKLDKNDELSDAWGNAFQVDFDTSQEQYIVTSSKIDSDGEIRKQR